MSESWTKQTERGSSGVVRFFIWLILTFGRATGRAFAVPISVYFIFFSRGAAPAIRKYLTLALGRRAGFRDVYKVYYAFSSTMMDRLFFLTDRFKTYDVEVVGAELVDQAVENGHGCLLLGSHLGSFEALRALGTYEKKLPVKALYYAHNSERFDAILKRLNPTAAEQLIPLGSPTSMIETKQFLDQGGVVGMLGDRAFEDSHMVEADFLGNPAPFPVWPMRLASATRAPVLLFYAFYRGGRSYKIVFEPFEDKIDRAQIYDEEQLRKLIANYAARLEHHCRAYPYNWFNFFDFWDWARKDE